MKSSNYCQINQCSLSPEDDKFIEDSIAHLEKSDTPETTLAALEDIFHYLKDKVSLKPSRAPDCTKTLSHIKDSYYTKKTKLGCLIFEVLFFTGNKFTGLHTHPEYLVDEIIQGSIEEKIYSKDKVTGKYEYQESILRSESNRRVSYRPCGLPHDVCAKEAPCISITLSLGKKSVESICQEK